MAGKENNVQHFLDLIKRSRRGKLKIYIGMIAGVGKTCRMLQETHSLLKKGVDIRLGYIETHGRAETIAMLAGLPVIPRRKLFYKGRELEEMDVQAIISTRPEIVVIDELAHSNIKGSKNEKRWQDVLEILEAGISVISAVNIQHIESLNEDVKMITGIEVNERIPDSIIALADEVVNIDLSADDLIHRLQEGNIYEKDKIEAALANFFKPEHILQLRELALKEVASQVERKVDVEVLKNSGLRHEKFLACISSNEKAAKNVIRKTARLASYYNAHWFVLYVQARGESPDRIPLNKQRHLINNFKLATELGAKVIQVKGNNIPHCILEQAAKFDITTVCMGKPHRLLFKIIFSRSIFNGLLKGLASYDIDLIILS